MTGGVVGGAGVGAAFGAPALAFIPVLGVIVVLTGVAVGASTGQAVESAQRPIGYPELISIPMSCRIAGESAAAAPAAGALLGMGIRGLPPGQARDTGLGERNAVLVTAVSAGSRADAAGLRSGDIIRTPGRVELLVPAQVQGMVYQGERLFGNGSANLRPPIGSIVEQATLAALGDGLRGGVRQVYAMPRPAARPAPRWWSTPCASKITTACCGSSPCRWWGSSATTKSMRDWRST